MKFYNCYFWYYSTIVIIFISLVLFIPIMVMLFLLTLISFQGWVWLIFFLKALSSKKISCHCCPSKKLLIKLLRSLSTSKKNFWSSRDIKWVESQSFFVYVEKTHVSFVVQTSSNSSLFVPLRDLDHFKILQWSLVIAYMDKHSNNFLFVCKKFYVSPVFFELIFMSIHMWPWILPNLISWIFTTLLIRPIILRGSCLAFISRFFMLFGSFIKTQINVHSFIYGSNSTSLTKVSKWLCFFSKAMFHVVNDLWVSKLKKADDLDVSSWIFNDITWVVEVINKLNLKRFYIDNFPISIAIFWFLSSIH